ncbi:MAG: YdcF family protein [Candidatus Desulforudis sp.]|nr:YdcF family protein [Desulforudis sp.]
MPMKTTPLAKLIITGAVLALFVAAFFSAGRLLVLDEPPRQADVIVVLAGDRGSRTAHGAALFHAGHAPCLIVSGGQIYHTTTSAALMRDHAVELGVPAAAVFPEDRADSTYENAVFTRELMEQHGFTSALVVSSNYHMRRVKFTFEREFRDSGIDLTYSAAADPDFDPARWWANNKSVIYTFTEYVKFIGYALGRNV